jgi:hypothetical protein
LLAFAADAGAFAALGGPDVGVAGVGVAAGQMVLQAAGQHGVAGRLLDPGQIQVRPCLTCSPDDLYEAFPSASSQVGRDSPVAGLS